MAVYAGNPTVHNYAAMLSWLFFVKVDLDGQFCFSDTVEQHNACVDQARANGVFG